MVVAPLRVTLFLISSKSRTFRVNKDLKNAPWQGNPPIFVNPKSYFFCEIQPHAKFSGTYDKPFWEKSDPRRKKEDKIRRVDHFSISLC